MKLELEFSELSKLTPNSFNGKDLEVQLNILRSENEKNRNKLGYYKTYIWVSYEDGSRIRFRYDIGCDKDPLTKITKR